MKLGQDARDAILTTTNERTNERLTFRNARTTTVTTVTTVTIRDASRASSLISRFVTEQIENPERGGVPVDPPRTERCVRPA